MKLRAIGHSRCGDKGQVLNISLIAFDESDYPRLAGYVTAARVKGAFCGPHRWRGDPLRVTGDWRAELCPAWQGGRWRHPDARARRAWQVVELGATRNGDS